MCLPAQIYTQGLGRQDFALENSPIGKLLHKITYVKTIKLS